jgi:cytochrome d ubiquinol oxidase subunit II
MGFIWFWIVAVMVAAYVVLDGFDIGVGILYPFLGRTQQDRSIMMRSIGPVWDGNEVWLLAGGGTLYFAFPLLYASAFSGFYLPLMIVLWLLIGRGVSIELRAHIDNPIWRSLFDGIFFLSSALLAIFLGAALANVIRGVPIGPDSYFFLPLWTNWRVGPHRSLPRHQGHRRSRRAHPATRPAPLDRSLRHHPRQSARDRHRPPHHAG